MAASKQPPNDRRRAWFTVAVLLLFSVAAPLHQFKVPPLIPLLMAAYGAGAAEAGLLMAVFAVSGLILALPSSLLFRRLGYRATGLLAAAAGVAGAVLGAASPSFPALLISRVIEGASITLTAVAAPAVIAMWFPEEKRAAPMGVWAVWVPLGSTAMFVAAPLLAQSLGWRSVWWFSAAYGVAVGLLYAAFVRMPRPPAGAVESAGRGPAPAAEAALPPAPSAAPASRADLAAVLRNGRLWLIAVVFLVFNYVAIGFLTWVPTFLNAVHGTALARASLLASIAGALTILSAPLGGWVSDLIGSRRLVIVVPLISMTVFWPLVLVLDEGGFLALAVAFGLVAGFIPTGVLAAAMETAGEARLGGMAMGVVQVGQNGGALLGPLAVGWLVGSPGGWALAFWSLVPVTVAGIIFGLLARVR